MKHLKHFSLTLLIALVSILSANAETFEVDGIYYKIRSSTDCEVENEYQNLYSGDVVIPSTVNYSGQTYNVTRIGVSAFSSCPELTSVTLPSSITSISSSAFTYSAALTSINVDKDNRYFSSFDGILFNKNQTTIEAFPKGKATEYIIPNNVTCIGSSAFHGCTELTKITIPNSVTSIEEFAFDDCKGLTEIIIPNSVVSIGNYAFMYCSELKSINIPNSTMRFGRSVFSGCSELTSVTISSNLTEIEGATDKPCGGGSRN